MNESTASQEGVVVLEDNSSAQEQEVVEGPVLEAINSIPTLPFWNSMLNVAAEAENGQNNPFVFNLVYVIGAGGSAAKGR